MSIQSTGLGRHERKQRRSRAADLEPLVVTPREACRLLSIGNTRLYELIGAGELESYLDGRARRVTMASIRARIDAKELPAPTEHRGLLFDDSGAYLGTLGASAVGLPKAPGLLTRKARPRFWSEAEADRQAELAI